MGGFGSSRWGSVLTRPTTDGVIALDVRELARSGALRTDACSEVGWFHHGEETDCIVLVGAPDALVLDYQTAGRDGSGGAVRERVALEWTPCTYGGDRPWFVCPGCGERRAVLHFVGGRFRCRACHGLAYGSTREAGWERAWRRAVKLRGQLGGEARAGWRSVSEKPSGMRWSTYRRLCRELDTDEGAAFDGFAPRHEALLVRSDDEHTSTR